MTISADVLKALRELADTKQLERSELTDLLRDGIHAALVKRYGPNVRAEIEIDDLKGEIHTMVLRSVVTEVEEEGTQISLEEARWISGRHIPQFDIRTLILSARAPSLDATAISQGQNLPVRRKCHRVDTSRVALQRSQRFA